jgi:hypothetical protein
MSRCLAIALLPVCLAALPAHPEEQAATIGKQRAAGSRLQWETREAGHPTLGEIRFAVVKNPVETPVGNAKVFSRAYVSCQKGSRKLAIELTNTAALDDPGGLQPGAMPRLICSRLAVSGDGKAPGDGKLVQEELLANWELSEIGDVLTRGFRAFPLRECISIGVVQDVLLPRGWAQKSTRVEFEILPYNRELDSVFVACGELTAYEPAAPAVASAPAGVSAPVKETGAPWRQARTTSSGKTNVRAAPSLQSATVTQLFPGSVILVQQTDGEWWRAKPSRGAAFGGYIRQDRLVFKK